MHQLDMKEFSQRLRDCRKSKKLTQKDMLPIAGVSYATYSDWENAVKMPGIEQLYSIANALDVSPIFLINGDSQATLMDGETLYQVLEKNKDLFDSITDSRIKAELISAKYNETLLKNRLVTSESH